MEKKFWKGLLLVGILMHFLAAALMPLGLDAHVHAVYVSDGMDDDEAHLEWGPLRPDAPDSSTPREIPADDKWFAWHSIFEIWFTIFSPSPTTLHVLGLVGGLGCLAAIYLLTKDLFEHEQALRLTALASIYQPLMRATGRVYQESIILMLVAISTYCIIKALRQEKQWNYWLAPPVICALIILSFKGMPIWYLIPAALALFASTRMEMNMIQIPIIALLVQLVVLYRNGISIMEPDIIPALLFSFVAYFFFVIGGILYFTKQDGKENEESIVISKGTSMIAACLIGWLAALLVTEAVALDRDFSDTYNSFSQTPRYLSLLLVPLWFARMLRTETSGLNLGLNRNAIVASVAIMLILNSYILAGSGPRGTDVIGEHLEDEIEDGEDILYLANSPFSLHRMYSIKFSMDPNSDGDNLGFWRTTDSDWDNELSQCENLGDVEWIVVYPYIDPVIPEGWIEIEFEGSDLVSDAYHLYTWGEEIERCP
jgi:hypothetical protein